ncbi:MAG: nuclear transport factor 2 family protein [Gammaproteobacteria bacterium]|jgi:hypothetical protein|nr:nuclear transport factor 2 family protein [Gammaproteobacteria bacterium]
MMTRDDLFNLLQHTYFAGIDGADANLAVEAMHENVAWVHTQVWEHDGHDRSTVDRLDGRAAVLEFLTKRIGEMQVEGIEHKVGQVITDGQSGAFRARVVGPTGDAKSFFGWVELKDGKISSYTVMPDR